MDFAKYWEHTDAVSQTLFFVLITLSIISWVVGILRILQSKKMAENVAEDLTQVISDKQKSVNGLGLAQQKIVIEQTLLQQISRYRFSTEKGLSVLGTTASIAPFIGLFGTVWGIFMPCTALASQDRRGLGRWQVLWVKH